MIRADLPVFGGKAIHIGAAHGGPLSFGAHCVDLDVRGCFVIVGGPGVCPGACWPRQFTWQGVGEAVVGAVSPAGGGGGGVWEAGVSKRGGDGGGGGGFPVIGANGGARVDVQKP